MTCHQLKSDISANVLRTFDRYFYTAYLLTFNCFEQLHVELKIWDRLQRKSARRCMSDSGNN